MRAVRIWLAVLVPLALASGSAQASSCYEPDRPSCSSEYGKFNDQSDFDSCHSEMETYKSNVDDFLDCTNREVRELKRKSDDALDEYNEAVKAFNDRASGN
jgi:hypothetical protein